MKVIIDELEDAELLTLLLNDESIEVQDEYLISKYNEEVRQESSITVQRNPGYYLGGIGW